MVKPPFFHGKHPAGGQWQRALELPPGATADRGMASLVRATRGSDVEPGVCWVCWGMGSLLFFCETHEMMVFSPN